MAQWPRRRRRANRRAVIISLAVPLLVAAIGASWWFRSRPDGGASGSATDQVTSDDRQWLSPDLYGSRSTSRDSGEGRLVDSPDSAGPIALLVGSPGTTTADWSAVQALLERHGIASIAVVPREQTWTTLIRATADSITARTTARSRSAAVITFGRGLDSLLAAVTMRPDLASWRLVVMAPGKPARTLWEAALATLPRWLQPTPATADTRLARWRGSVLIARAADDPSFDSVAAQRIAPTGALMLVIPGGGFGDAPRHPTDDAWRGVLDFIRGSAARQDVVVPSAVDSVTPASTAATPPPRSGIRPPPQPLRR